MCQFQFRVSSDEKCVQVEIYKIQNFNENWKSLQGFLSVYNVNITNNVKDLRCRPEETLASFFLAFDNNKKLKSSLFSLDYLATNNKP